MESCKRLQLLCHLFASTPSQQFTQSSSMFGAYKVCLSYLMLSIHNNLSQKWCQRKTPDLICSAILYKVQLDLIIFLAPLLFGKGGTQVSESQMEEGGVIAGRTGRIIKGRTET